MTTFPAASPRRLTRPSPLDISHDLTRFDCGKGPLNDWLRDRAHKSDGRSARTYVVCCDKAVVGYYCLATGAGKQANLPGKLKRNTPDPVPLMVIGRLAVDAGFKRQGIGEGLLKDAFIRILGASEIAGCRAALVHAIDLEAVTFYERYGFIEFPAGSQTLFLPIETIAAGLP